MYIRRTTKTHKGKTYTNYLLVESIHTPKGPRQRIICSLGSLAPAPRQQWLSLAHRLQASLEGQNSLLPANPQVEALAEKVRRGPKAHLQPSTACGATLAVDPERVTVEKAREAGPVHVGHQMWRQLGLSEILRGAGLSERACQLSEAMTLNRLIFPLSEHAMPDWMGRTALGDIFRTDFSARRDDALYRNLDRLEPNRERIEAELAYHRLVAIEKRFLDQGVHTSWWTLREQLSTHQVVTVVLPTTEGRVLKIRKGTTPEAIHREIYATLRMPTEVMKPVKSWLGPSA